MSFKDDIKPYFQVNDFPTESQFYEFFEKIRWSDEPLTILEITGLQSILNGLATPVDEFTTDGGVQAYTIPAGYLLEKIILKPQANCNAYCNNQGSIDVGDIILEEPVTSANGAVWIVNKMAFAAKTVEVYGLPNNSKAYFIKRKIVA